MNNFVRFNPHQYEEHLSPFGRKVLGTLIKQWNAERFPSRDHNRNTSALHCPSHRYNKSHGRVLTFAEPSTRINNSLCNPANLPVDFYDDSPFEDPEIENNVRTAPPTTTTMLLPPPPEFVAPLPIQTVQKNPARPPISALPVIAAPVDQRVPIPFPVTTSAQLVTAAETNTNYDQVNFSRDALISSLDTDNRINEIRYIFGTNEDNINNTQTIDTARNVLEGCQSAINVNWDNMFDTELLRDMDTSVKQVADVTNKPFKKDKVSNIKFLDDMLYNNNPKEDNTDKKSEQSNTGTKGPKRKNQTKVTVTIPKKVKKIKTDVKMKSKTISKIYKQNNKVTDSVKNWLNDVDANNPVEEFLGPLVVAELKTTKAKDKHEIVEPIPHQRAKKVVQAQLTNRGGIMKFGKPTKNNMENHKEAPKTEETTSENVHKDKQQTVKDKKSKSKFVAPIKSQIPVTDVTYEINEVNETNFRKLKLDTIRDKEIIAVLLYSNGFCQLNNQYIDDACVPEGVMFNLEDLFFYLKGGDTVTDVVSEILSNNATICYDGKALLIYLMSTLKLNLDHTYNFKIIDIKIGGSLLEPDSPPETFSALQRLTGSEPEYTIATTCNKQKAAWYATLLSTTAAAVRNKLEQEDLLQVFVNIEMGILPIIADMEQRGVCVDMEKLKVMEKILLTKMKDVESECATAAGRSFQINSTVQVRALLYDELKLDEKAGLKVRGTLTTGAKSTSEAMLKSLVSLHPLPRLILEYRHLHKAHATFLQGVAQYARGGMVRPVWVQTAAATGRIASSNPNLQAIPKVPFRLRLFPENDIVHTEESLRFRSIYISRPNHVILAADWRHVECRVFARAAADTSLQRALEAPDLFRRLAADWLQKPEDEISSADRERTKRIVYASLYGAGPRKLMDILDVDYSQALSIATSFDRTFPSLRSFGRRVAAQCLASDGRVATLCGRARTLPHIAGADAAQRSHAERQALNFIVQGSAADVCKLAMGVAVRALQERGLRARLLLQIHDELVWEVDHQDLPLAADVIRSAMEQCGCPAGLPTLPVALSVGRSWGELQPYPPQHPHTDSQPFEL